MQTIYRHLELILSLPQESKRDAKPKIVHNVEPTSDISASLAKLQLTVDGMVKTQELMMNRIVKLERAQQQAPRPTYKG